MSAIAAMSIAEVEQEIQEEFDLFDDQMDKYEHIIEMGRDMDPMDEVFKTDASLVKGCQSKVWLRTYQEQGHIFFQADSNTVITKGIIALLIRVLNGRKADDIVACPLQFIDNIDLNSHLTSQRSNGLSAMVQRMKADAQRLG